jgi:hypothetical protein
MPKIPVDPFSVTPAWLSEAIRADVRECELEQIGIGVGLLGRLYRARLEGGPDVPATVVVKLPTLDLTARTNLCEDLEMYLRATTSPRSMKRHTTSSSYSKTSAGCGWPTSSWVAR